MDHLIVSPAMIFCFKPGASDMILWVSAGPSTRTHIGKGHIFWQLGYSSAMPARAMACHMETEMEA